MFSKTICILFDVYSLKSTQFGCSGLSTFNMQSRIEDKILSVQAENGRFASLSFVKAKNVHCLLFKCLLFPESKVFFSLKLVLTSQNTANDL